jgi:hypothetical protein
MGRDCTGTVTDSHLPAKRTVCLDDPDGITNYFAETAASRKAVAR